MGGDWKRSTLIYSRERSARAIVSLAKGHWNGKLTMIAQIQEDGENEGREGDQAAVYPPRRQRQLGQFCSLAPSTGTQGK